MDITGVNEKFIENFKNSDGFYDLTPYINGTGFGIKRKLNNKDKDNVSLLSFYIPDGEFQSDGNYKNIDLRVSYGRDTENGVKMRFIEESRLSDPVDLISKDYYYDINQNKFFDKREEISAHDLLNNVYDSHIKPTRKIKGFWIRTKLFFWRVAIRKIFNYFSSFFISFLYIISGDIYRFEPFSEREILNGKTISSQLPIKHWEKQRKDIEDIKKSEKIKMLGYYGAYWPIIFYSIFHLFLYIIFEYFDFKPKLITNILGNNFLILVYVVSSLWIVEKVMPVILMKLAKISSKISGSSLVKEIKI